MNRVSIWALIIGVGGFYALANTLVGCGSDSPVSVDSGASGGTGGASGTGGGSGTGGSSGTGGTGGSGTGGTGGTEQPDAAVQVDVRRGDSDGGRRREGGGFDGGMIPMCPVEPDGKTCDPAQPRCTTGGNGTPRISCFCLNDKWSCPALHLDGGSLAECPANARNMTCQTAGAICRGAGDAGGFGCFCRNNNGQLTWACSGN